MTISFKATAAGAKLFSPPSNVIVHAFQELQSVRGQLPSINQLTLVAVQDIEELIDVGTNHISPTFCHFVAAVIIGQELTEGLTAALDASKSRGLQQSMNR